MAVRDGTFTRTVLSRHASGDAVIFLGILNRTAHLTVLDDAIVIHGYSTDVRILPFDVGSDIQMAYGST